MSELSYLLSVQAANLREGNGLAEELRTGLEQSAPGVTAERARERDDTQDLGTAVALVLSAPAVIAIARGIGQFLQKHQNASLEIKTKGGHVILKNVTSRTALEVIREVLSGGAASDTG